MNTTGTGDVMDGNDSAVIPLFSGWETRASACGPVFDSVHFEIRLAWSAMSHRMAGPSMLHFYSFFVIYSEASAA